GLVRARDGTVRRQPAHPAARRVHRRRAAPLAGRRSLAQRPGAFTSTPQATRAPELPVGSVLKSSAVACTTRALPSASHTDEGPEPSESCSVVVSMRPVPSGPTVRFGRSPACEPCGFSAPCCLFVGLKCGPALLKSWLARAGASGEARRSKAVSASVLAPASIPALARRERDHSANSRECPGTPSGEIRI